MLTRFVLAALRQVWPGKRRCLTGHPREGMGAEVALEKVKTEMKGTGGGRWMTRAEAKKASKRARREADKAAVRAKNH